MQRKSNAYKNTCACGLGLNLCMCALTEKRWDTIVSHVVIKNTFVWSSCCWWRTGDQSAGADGTVHRDHAWVQLNVPGPPYQMVTVLYELDSAGQTLLCTQISWSGRGHCSGGDQHWPRYRSPSVSHSLSVLVLATTDHVFGTGSVQNQEPQTFWIWQTGE